MKLIDFFKARSGVAGLFIDKSERDTGASFDNLASDYMLSRSLYASAPADNSNYYNYSLGNYCTKLYIDTFCWFIGLPDVSADSDLFTKQAQQFLQRNKTALFNIYRQTMIDGKHFVWVRIEKSELGKTEIRIKQLPLEFVVEKESIKNLDGGYKKLVIEQKEKWLEDNTEKKCTVKITLEAGREVITIDGDLPPQYESARIETKTPFHFVPVFCLYNNKQTFLQDGIPEISPAVPYIRRYDATLRKLGKHIDDILEPRVQIKVKDPEKFMKLSFSLDDSAIRRISEGKQAIDPTQFKVAILDTDDGNGGVSYVSQNNNVESAISLLKLLHWIIVEMTMPEYLYGTALNGNYASVKEQSPVWAKKVEGRQGEYSEFYYWLLEVFRIAKNSIAERDIFAADGGTENITVDWQELTAKDDVAVMNALATFVNAMDKALTLGLISPKTAFNTLKNFITIPADFETETKDNQAWQKLKMNIDAIQDRIRSGDLEASEAIAGVFENS